MVYNFFCFQMLLTLKKQDIGCVIAFNIQPMSRAYLCILLKANFASWLQVGGF